MEPYASKTFTADLVREGSWGESELGTHESTMDLYIDGFKGFIEWDIPELEITEEIGLTFVMTGLGQLVLTDYDGVFSLPKEAIELLRENNVRVSEEFE